MRNLFDVPWDEIELKHVQAFLADASDEGISWEAKGDDARGAWGPTGLLKATCAFANSTLGGYLIVGARWDKTARKWSLPGLEQPLKDPLSDWIGRIIRNGIEPYPSITIKQPWAGQLGPICVMRIEPVSVPPAITRDGLIYERVVGESIKVTTTDALARLFARGQSARTRAEIGASALSSAPDALTDTKPAILSITISPTGWPDDIRDRVLMPSAIEEGKRVISRRYISRISVEVTQDGFSAWTETMGEGNVLQVSRRGLSVRLIFFDDMPHGVGLAQGGALAAHAERLGPFVEWLGGYGQSFVSARANWVREDRGGMSWASDWVGSPTLSKGEVDRLVRELRRGAGIADLEPEA